MGSGSKPHCIRLMALTEKGVVDSRRTAISLSAITRKPIEIINIRANGGVAGLRRQHLTALKATADLFHAKVENLKLGTDWIRLFPAPDKFEGGVGKN